MTIFGLRLRCWQPSRHANAFRLPLSNYMNLAVICNDSWGGLQDVQSFFDRFAAAEAPQLIDANWATLWQVIRYHQSCAESEGHAR